MARTKNDDGRPQETWAYVRMSTDLQEDSPLTQGQMTAQFVNEQKLPNWTRTYVDRAITGALVEKRPGVIAFLTDAEKLRPACVVFYKLDRAFRNSEEQAVALNRLKRLGVQVWKVRDPNLQGPMGELIDGILGNINQFERQLTGARIRDHNLAMAQRGEWPGGAAPFGYVYRKAVREQVGRKRVTVEKGELLPCPEERAVARQLWDWALDGYRKVEVVDLANAAGYRRRNGAPWNTEALTLMLISKVYAGYVPFARHVNQHGRMKRQHDRAEWFPGHHEPIVTLEEWHRVQITTNSQMGQRRAHSRARVELAGLIRCSICGGPVVGSSNSSEGYRYTCQAAVSHAAQHSIWARPDWVIHGALSSILDEVRDQVRLATLEPQSKHSSDDRTTERELERVRAQMGRLRDSYEIGAYKGAMADYQRKWRELEAKVAALEDAQARAAPTTENQEAMFAAVRDWDALYKLALTVRERQRLWFSLFEWVRTDGLTLTAHLRHLDQTIDRTWQLTLPPPRTRRPGSKCGRGIAGMRSRGESRSYRADQGPTPVLAGDHATSASIDHPTGDR